MSFLMYPSWQGRRYPSRSRTSSCRDRVYDNSDQSCWTVFTWHWRCWSITEPLSWSGTDVLQSTEERLRQCTPWQVSISISPRSATECRLKVQTRCVPVTSSTRNSSLWRTNHDKKFMKKITLSIYFFLKFSHMSFLLVDMGDHLSALKRAVCQIFLLILKVCDRSWFGKLFVPWSGRSCFDSCPALYELSTDTLFLSSPWSYLRDVLQITCRQDL